MNNKLGQEWVRADSGLRRRVIVLLVVLAILGVLAFLLLEQWLTKLQAAEPADAIPALRRALVWISVAMGVSLAAFAGYFWRLGRRMAQAERFPPPGMKVVRDTRVIAGPAARHRGWLLQGVAAVLVICAVAVVVIMNFRILPGA